MKNMRFCAVLACLVATSWLWAGRCFPSWAEVNDDYEIPSPRTPGKEYQDLAVSCLSAGVASPPLSEIRDQRLDSVVVNLAWIFEMYLGGDFESYLQFHRWDLGQHQAPRPFAAEELSLLIQNNFSVQPNEIPKGWMATLQLSWELLYPHPVMAKVYPETARFELHTQGIENGVFKQEDFYADLEARRASFAKRINHRITVPHGRSVETIALEQKELEWFDFQVDVMLGQGLGIAASILLRFVWDGVNDDWFLDRAITIYPDSFGLSSRSKSLLLF